MREQDRTARVLIAEDSLVIRSLLKRHLEQQGYEVIEATDGEHALSLIFELEPDVVLCDIEMPKLDGYAVLKEMRQEAALSNIPVVFLTARTSTEDVVEGLRLGAHDYLRKPFEPAELVARVSGAVRLKHLQDELRERNAELDAISRIDIVTGLPNRRHLLEHLSQETAAARRRGEQFAVLMVDVDHFKKVNDRYGHESGDVVLRIVAERLQSACRGEDLVGRWGGEEFVVVSPATDVIGAKGLGERLRAAVAATTVPVDETANQSVTVSIGVVVGTGDIDELLRRSDMAMFEAKQSGRNRVVVAPAAVPGSSSD